MSSSEISVLLREWRGGRSAARDDLFGHAYAELRKMARCQRRRSWNVETLNTTALVHEAYLKLVDCSAQNWENRAHFLATAATAMRHILINYAERKRALKRGGDWREVSLADAAQRGGGRLETLLAIQQALVVLDRLDPRLTQIVDCRFFGGLSESEIACVLGVTERTVRRDWRKAKAVLAKMLANAPLAAIAE
jgi:RNA polymerase sigma factor (TIGR02999 family)